MFSEGASEGVRPHWCGNPECDNLSGPSELQLKTLACGGGCGVRYCGGGCQAAAWRRGHRLSCRELERRREGREAESL